MIGLRDIVRDRAGSWEDASRTFAWPPIDRYNIAGDILNRPSDATALMTFDAGGVSRVSFGELDAMSGRLAAGLESLGVQAGDRVAVKLSQSVEMAVVVLAVLRAGAILVPISNVLGRDGLLHRLRDCRPRVLVAMGSEDDVALADEAGLPLVAARSDAPEPTVHGLIDSSPGPIGEIVPTTPDTPALLLYTSGTTGSPKGVLHGHRVVLGHYAVDYAFDYVRPDDVAYSPVDWAWAGGLFLGLLVPLAFGIPVVAFREPRFDTERALELMRVCGVTIGLFPPTVLRLLRQSGLVTPTVAQGLRLRCFVTGAEAVEPELFGWAADALGVTVNNAYGLTEANALIGHSHALGDLDLRCLGRPYPGRRVAVLDDMLAPVPAGQPGQIMLAADDPVCMLGYWNDPEATAARIVDGWLRTGDTAHVDEQGQLYFHGRSDDIIKSGAYRIGPAEVEAVILQNDAVAECAVVGLPDPVRGQIITAVVKLRDPDGVSDELTSAFQSAVRQKVGAHAYPRAVRYVDALPKTATGKIDRATLRRDLTDGQVA